MRRSPLAEISRIVIATQRALWRDALAEAMRPPNGDR